VKFGEPESAELKRGMRAQINVFERAKLSIDAILADINLALSLISEWSYDQIGQIPFNLKN